MQTQRVITLEQLKKALYKAINQSVADTAHTRDEDYEGKPLKHAGELPVIVASAVDDQPHYIGSMMCLPACQATDQKASFTLREADKDGGRMTADGLVDGLTDMEAIAPAWDAKLQPKFSGDFLVNIRCVALVNGHVILAEFESQVPSNVKA